MSADLLEHRIMETLAEDYPGYAITLRQSFHDTKPCGFVPIKWNGSSIAIKGRWWSEKPVFYVRRTAE